MSYQRSACVVSSALIIAMLAIGCAPSAGTEPSVSSRDVERREVHVERDVNHTPADPNLQKLRQTIFEMPLDNIGFVDVVAFLADVSDIDIYTNWRALEGMGIDRATPVTLRANNLPLNEAIELILNDVGGGTVELGYVMLPSGVLKISTMEELNQEVETRVYDIAHLKPSADTTTPAETNLLSAISAAIQASTTQPTVPLTWTDQLMEVIQESIEPETWRDAGGSVGSIASYGTKLVVTSSPLVLPKVESLLQQLAEPPEAGMGIEMSKK